jgi:hypothetical protein
MPLSQQQRAAVQLAARPLPPQDRQAFLEAVNKELRGSVDPGDGDVHRAIRKVQSQFLDPPLMRGSPLPAFRASPRSFFA